MLPFMTTWMNLEVLCQSENKSYRERQIVYDLTYMWNKKQQNSEKRTKVVTKVEGEEGN